MILSISFYSSVKLSSFTFLHKVLAAQLCLTLHNTMDCSPPGSSVHGILQAKVMEWVAILFTRGSSQPRNWTQDSALQEVSLPSEPFLFETLQSLFYFSSEDASLSKLLFVYLIIVFPIQVPKFPYSSYIWKQQPFYTPYLWWLFISFLRK